MPWRQIPRIPGYISCITVALRVPAEDVLNTAPCLCPCAGADAGSSVCAVRRAEPGPNKPSVTKGTPPCPLFGVFMRLG